MKSKPRPGQPFVVKHGDFATTRLIDINEHYHQSIPTGDAKTMAKEAGLDLVCFNKPDEKTLALCKIVDFGKWKYSNEKKKKKQVKEGKQITKEIRLSPVISSNDINHKIKHVKGFIEDGNDVVLFMRIKGRQRAHFDVAEEKMNEIVAMCLEYSEEVSRRKNPSMIAVRLSSNKKEKK